MIKASRLIAWCRSLAINKKREKNEHNTDIYNTSMAKRNN